MPTLTLEIAQELLEAVEGEIDAIDANKFDAIDDAAAEALAKHPDSLLLDGLTHLSDATAKALANHRSYKLSLKGLTQLSDAAAKMLAENIITKYASHKAPINATPRNQPRTLVTLRLHNTDDSAFIVEQARQFDRFGSYLEIFQRLLDGNRVLGVSGRVEFLVAELNGERAGFAAVEWTETAGKIHGIAVDPRSKRQGVARELLAEIQRRAVERGSQHLECLTAETDNSAAQALFVQNGFVNRGVAGRYPNGQRAITLKFTLPGH
jgi:ribosomal protein S18 acetylase RimI-like enzyme